MWFLSDGFMCIEVSIKHIVVIYIDYYGSVDAKYFSCLLYPLVIGQISCDISHGGTILSFLLIMCGCLDYIVRPSNLLLFSLLLVNP